MGNPKDMRLPDSQADEAKEKWVGVWSFKGEADSHRKMGRTNVK